MLKRVHPMSGELAGVGTLAKSCYQLLGVCSPVYYEYRKGLQSLTRMRRQWLIGSVREVYAASRGTYRSLRIRTRLTRGMDVRVSVYPAAELMSPAGIAGPTKVKKLRGTLVHLPPSRQFIVGPSEPSAGCGQRRDRSYDNDTLTTRFRREPSGESGYNSNIKSCEIAGQRPVQGTTGSTRDTRPR